MPTGPSGPQGGRLASRRGWARTGPPRPPLVQDTSTSTYLTGSHRVFLFYYRQSQGQPLLSNKRNALNGLFLACPELGAGGLPDARAVWTRSQTRWAWGSPRLHPPQLPLPAGDGMKQELGGLGCGDKGRPPPTKVAPPPRRTVAVSSPAGRGVSWESPTLGRKRRERPAAARGGGPAGAGRALTTHRSPHAPWALPTREPCFGGQGTTRREPQVTFLVPRGTLLPPLAHPL